MGDLQNTNHIKQNVLKIILLVGVLVGLISISTVWLVKKTELRELNKNLPKGVRLEETAGQCKLVNEKDGYIIKIPDRASGKIEEASYWIEGLIYKSFPEKIRKALLPETKLHILTDQLENDIYIICFELKQDVSLEQFTEAFRTFSSTSSKISIEKIKTKNLMVTKFTGVNSPLSRYFFKANSKIYMLQMVEYGTHEYVRSIIENSKWDL